MEEITLEDAHALVGGFMHHWVLTEGKIDSVIAESLDLSLSQYFLFGRVLTFNQKKTILGRLVELSCLTSAEKKNFKDLMKKIGKLQKDRNIVAHSVFTIDLDKKRVAFVNVKSSGEFEYPPPVWSKKEFLKKDNRLRYIDRQLVMLRQSIERQKPLGESQKSILGRIDHMVDDILATYPIEIPWE